jgi:hypothetical protein
MKQSSPDAATTNDNNPQGADKEDHKISFQECLINRD